MGTRLHSIDAFRGIAVLAVVAFHYLVKWQDAIGVNWLWARVAEGGGYGVHVFFVISGLVIGLSADRAGNAWEFLVRRFARIYPAFLAAAVLTFSLTSWGLPEFRRSWCDLLGNVLIDPRPFGHDFIDGVYWSLVVEVKFYAWMGMAILVFRERFWVGISAVALGGQLARESWVKYLLVPEWWSYFIFGLGLYFWLLKGRSREALFLFLVATMCFANNPVTELHGALFVGGTLMAMIVVLHQGWRMDSVFLEPLVKLGVISYSVYLLHQNIGVSLMSVLVFLGVPSFVSLATTFLCVVVVSYWFYQYVELRTARWTTNAVLGWRRKTVAPVVEGS